MALAGLNHKLGYRGPTNAVLSFGGGSWRPGRCSGRDRLSRRRARRRHEADVPHDERRPHRGRAGAAALGFAGYAVSLDYAKERRQGRPLTRGAKDPNRPPVALIEHADVKRMLLAQKAYAEGGIALGLYAARLLDEQATGTEAGVAEAGELLEILIPVVKSWPSEWCLEANSLAIQVLGGAGYCRDFPVEQYWRDNRLNMIHEGTHGIQALDLLGRKVVQRGGACLGALGARVFSTVAAARAAGLGSEADQLESAWAQAVATASAAWSTDARADALANATPYLQGFGHVVLAWIWLDLSVAALDGAHPEGPGKVAAMRYFFAYELPKVGAWLDVVARREALCRDLDPSVL